MVSNETPLIQNISNKNEKKDFYKISRKILYQKYNDIFSFKKILADFLIFNNKCRLTLFFKEFLISDNSCEFLRHFYLKEDIKNILNKILEIYCLYSKIYPNYIILKENKFLYKNIRKKQKMIDENNKNNELEKNEKDNNINNKDNELFTLSIRNEIKEFQEESINKNNIDSLSNNKIISTNTKKINDNWAFISSKNLNMNLNNSKNNNNNQSNKNMSFDSFWTNDTNNLSTLLNAINDKINIDENKKNKNKENNNIKKKDLSNNNKFAKNHNHNQRKKEIKSTSKKTFKININNKLDNNNNKKTSSENSRNINLRTKNNQNIINNLKTTKPLQSSLSNSINTPFGLLNKVNNIYNRLLTEKNLDKEIKKNIHQYYSIQRDKSDKNIRNNPKKIIPSFVTKQKVFSKENKNTTMKKNNEYNLLIKNNDLNNKCDKYIKKKFSPHEFLKIVLDKSKKNSLNDKFIKEENAKNGSFNTNILYNTNKNFNNLRNKKYYLKKYFTNNNMHLKDLNQRYTYNLTESNSQALINLKKEKEFNSSSNYNKNNKSNKNKDNSKEKNRKTLNNCQTSANYYISKIKNIYNISQKHFLMKKKNTEDIVLCIREKILKRELGTAYIKKKCFSPLSNDYHLRYSLSRSCKIKNEKKNNHKNNEKLIRRIIINNEIKNKLINIKKSIRKHFILHDISNKE